MTISTYRSALPTTILALALAAPVAANAYVGPGAGLTALGTVFAFVGAVLLAIVGFIWYPIKRLVKGRRKPRDKADRPS